MQAVKECLRPPYRWRGCAKPCFKNRVFQEQAGYQAPTCVMVVVAYLYVMYVYLQHGQRFVTRAMGGPPVADPVPAMRPRAGHPCPRATAASEHCLRTTVAQRVHVSTLVAMAESTAGSRNCTRHQRLAAARSHHLTPSPLMCFLQSRLRLVTTSNCSTVSLRKMDRTSTYTNLCGLKAPTRQA